jgi:hypothetical protein
MKISVTVAAIIAAVAVTPLLVPVKAELPVNWKQTRLAPSQTEFDWGGWHIKVTKLVLSSAFQDSFSVHSAESDSIFVVLGLAVTNTSTKGDSFIPQNTIKIGIGSNEFDAEDIESGAADYLKYIEPTLTRARWCYFEVPKSQIGNSFVLRFKEMFGSNVDVSVALETPMQAETPASIASSNSANSDQQAQLNRAEQNLNNLWTALPQNQRNRLRNEQRRWIQYKDNLPIDEKIRTVEQRCSYLQSFIR